MDIEHIHDNIHVRILRCAPRKWILKVKTSLQGKGEMKTFWLKGRTGPIKGIPKKNKITDTAPAKKESKLKDRKANVDPPPARMRPVKEEAPPKAKPPSPKKEPPKLKPKPPSPKKEPPKPKPPSPKKENIKSRTPTPKREPPNIKSPSPTIQPKPPTPRKKTPTPKREVSPVAAPTIRVPDKQALPTKQVEPITIAVQPAARDNRVESAKISPANETITGKRVYEDGSNMKDLNHKNANRNGLTRPDSPVASEKMNGSKASVGLLPEGDLPKGKAQSCTCNIL